MTEAKELDNLLGSDEEEPKKTEEGEEEEKEEVEEEKEFVMPEKFKGKSAEEIAKSYVELEKMIERKAQERANEILKEKELEEEEEEEEIKPPLTPEGKPDFSGMTPDQFAEWVIQEIERRAEAKAKTIFEESTRVKESVAAEIAAAQENYPALKTSSEYRELVLSLIELAAQKGEILSLEDACKKVEAVIGGKKEIEKEEEEKLKKAKAIVERGSGAPVPGAPETEEERIKRALLGTGPKSSLGGLGI